MNENQTNLQTNNENAEMGMQNENLQQSQSNGQNQSNQQNQGNQTSLERTIVNGKVVPLSEAQAMEEQFNKQNTSTGIQQHHDNSSEAVQAGQVAQNQVSPQQEQTIKQANVQSGQSHLSQIVGKGNHKHKFKNRKIIKPSKILLIKRQRQKQRQKRNNKK